jgi:hypothetical protein
MPKFIIRLRQPISYNDCKSFIDYVLTKSKKSTYLQNLTKSYAYEGGFSCIDKCDIRFYGVLDEFIERISSKECFYNEHEWSNDEINEFNIIINSYFTELIII